MPEPPSATADAHQTPYTQHGVPVSPFSRAGLSSFLIHECGYLPGGVHWHYPGICSPYWRLYYNHAPGSYVRFLKRNLALGPERVLVIPEGVTFDAVGELGTSHLWLHFSPIHQPVPALSEPVTVPLAAGMAAAVADLVDAHAERGADTGLQRLYHSAAALLHATFARLSRPLERLYPERLAALIAQIDGNPAGDMSNARLARAAGMSIESFIRWFKQHTGTTPAAYVTRSRVRAAARLLVLSERSIEQIAAETGFPNRHYLSRVFKAHMGSGPATFRRRQVRA